MKIATSKLITSVATIVVLLFCMQGHAQCNFGAFELDHDAGRYDFFECTSLATFNAGDGTKLYAGYLGGFNALRAWADGRWTPIAGAPSTITSLYVWDDGSGDALYIGTGGGANLWKWDGATFTHLGNFSNAGGAGTPVIWAMHIFDLEVNPFEPDGSSVLAVGGNFTSVNGVAADCLAFWDGANWVGANNVRGPVGALFSYVDGPLEPGEIETIRIGVLGGVDLLFTNDGGPTANPIVNLDGQTWAIESFGGICLGGEYGASTPVLTFPIPGTVYDMLAWDDGSGEKLYVAGDFTHYAPIGIERGVLVVDLDGNVYPLGEGTGVDSPGESINAIAVFREAEAHGHSIYFGGSFDYTDGTDTFFDVVRFGCPVPLPTVVDSTWELTNIYHLADAVGAHYSEVDDALYVGRRNTTFGPRGLYRIDMNDSLTPIWTGDDIIGVEVDDAGNVYTTDDFSGVVFRVDHGTTTRSVWVSGWHSGDDDPIGLAIAPANAAGWFDPGDAFMIDRGSGGLDEVWMWSVTAAEGETALHADDGTLDNALDITVSQNKVYVCDTAGSSPGVIYWVNSGGGLQAMPLSETIESPAGIDYNFARNTIYVLDALSGGSRIVAVDEYNSGEVTDVITGLNFTGTTWTGIDTDATGQRLFVTDGGAGRIYEFTSTIPCPPGDVSGNNITGFSDVTAVDNDAGCDEPVDCTCIGDVNQDCRTDFSDMGIVLSNYNLSCPDSNPGLLPASVLPLVNVYPTPWPETPPDSGVYYTVDLMVLPHTLDQWTGTQASAQVVGLGAFWDDPEGSNVWEPTQWFQPGSMNLQYDSFYQPTHEDSIAYPFFFGPISNLPQARDCAWYAPPRNHTEGPYVVARYTIRLEDSEASDGVFLTTANTGTPYMELDGQMMTYYGGESLVPFSRTIYRGVDCIADVTDDGVIDGLDVNGVLFGYQKNADGDVDGDGDTDRDDVALFVAGFECPDEPTVKGGPVSHDVVQIDNTAGNTDSTPFDGGVTHFTFDLQINLGVDYWTSTEADAELTEPGYIFFQHHFGVSGFGPPGSHLIDISPSLRFDTFMTRPGVLVDALPPLVPDVAATTTTHLHLTWFDVVPPLQPGTIARYTVESLEPITNMDIVPAGAAPPDATVIGTIVGDSTVASTGVMRHPFAYDIIISNPAPPCPADIAEDDDVVNVFDLLELLANWGTSGAGADIAEPNDVVNVFDLLALLSAWGTCE